MSERKNGAKPPKKKQPKSDPRVSYDDFKEHEGQKYTGMKVGRSHKWYYDQGVWKETKITPDLWQISYAVSKRRAGRAPEGSGVPVGTEYHWYVLAHQTINKITANDYTTSLTGLKFKIAHKRAGSEKWSATPRTQRKRMIQFLQGVIADLEAQQEAEPSASKTGRAKATTGKGKAARAKAPTARAAAKKPATPPSMKRPTRRRRKVAT